MSEEKKPEVSEASKTEISGETRARALHFLEKGLRLLALTEQGVTCREFNERLADVKTDWEILNLVGWPSVLGDTNTYWIAMCAIESWNHAAKIWNTELKTPKPDFAMLHKSGSDIHNDFVATMYVLKFSEHESDLFGLVRSFQEGKTKDQLLKRLEDIKDRRAKNAKLAGQRILPDSIEAQTRLESYPDELLRWCFLAGKQFFSLAREALGNKLRE